MYASFGESRPAFDGGTDPMLGRETVEMMYGSDDLHELLTERDAFDYTAGELENEPTLTQGQDADLKVNDTTWRLRVWLCRGDTADGHPWENTIEVEVEILGRWVTVARYDGGEVAGDA